MQVKRVGRLDKRKMWREWRQVQNINSQSRRKDSDGQRRECGEFINTDRGELGQIDAGMVR